MSRTRIRHVRIFDGTGVAPFAGEVQINGAMIEAVGTQLPAAAADVRLIDGLGLTLMPGLIEAHAHLTWPSSVERVINAMHVPLEEHVQITEQNARITLDHGFTSAWSAGSLGEHIEPALRDRIDAGAIPGPRLRASALEKGSEGVLGVPAGHDPTHERGADGLAAYVRQMKAIGCDTIKFLLSSDEAFQPGGSQTLMYSEAEMQAVGAAARACDIWLSCHAQAAEAIKRAVRAGFRAIYHCTHADSEALDLLEQHRDTLFVAPAPGLLWARCHEARDFGIDAARAAAMGATSGLELMQRVVPELRRRGVRVLPGGDYGFPYNPIGRNARDLELFVRLFGFTPTAALVAATREAGELMAMPVGIVAPGMYADLLLVAGDPTKDVSILQDKQKLRAIMKNGAFHKALPPH